MIYERLSTCTSFLRAALQVFFFFFIFGWLKSLVSLECIIYLLLNNIATTPMTPTAKSYCSRGLYYLWLFKIWDMAFMSFSYLKFAMDLF